MSDSILGGSCDGTLGGSVGAPAGQDACPNGTSTRHIVSALCEERLNLSGHSTMVGERGAEAFAFRESVRPDGRAAVADRQGDRSCSFKIVGSSPQHEDQTIPVCRLLVAKLNADGGNWDQPSEGEQDSHDDCLAFDMRNEETVLRVQVVRAITDARLSEEWARHRALDKQDVDVSEIVSHIETAIRHKEVRIPAKARKKLTLALDATLLPVMTFDHVINSFRSEHGTWADSLGFEGIWIVGPVSSLVRRLDWP